MKKTYSPQTPAIAVLSATLGLACTFAQAQSMPEKVGAGRGTVNPFVENLSAAKDTVVATASRLVGADVPASSNDVVAKNVTVATSAQVAISNSPEPATPAVSGSAAIKALNAPQMKPLAANPVKTPTVDTEGAINPLSGKSFSEEQLMRVLNANKLVTEIGRQQVEQAKNVVELSKAAGDARQIESVKQRSDAINVAPKKPIKPVKVDESLSPGEQLMQGSAGATWTGAQTIWGGAGVSGGGMASGTVQIGAENFTPQARTDANQARVVYVDTQPAKTVPGQVAGMGSSLVPAPMLSPLPPQMPR